VKINLYSTLGCHLCEQAKSILWPLLLQYQHDLVEIDIATSDELIERYGIRIPVLSDTNNVNELNWPFGPQDVEQFFLSLKKI
jgi:hypothetical protein